MILLGLLLWIPVVAWWWQRTQLWLLDLIVIPLGILIGSLALGMVVIGLLRGRHVLLACVLVPLLLASFAVTGPYASQRPQLWMWIHRPMYTAALSHDPGTDYYGSTLPPNLRVLAVDGRSSAKDGVRFFPQWIGIPDDAHGFLYSPGRAPVGFDMYGLECREPRDLGDGWW